MRESKERDKPIESTFSMDFRFADTFCSAHGIERKNCKP